MSDYSNFDEQIYELTKKFTEEDVSAIIEWVIQYDREQCNSNKDKEVTLRAKTLIDMVDTSFYYTGYLDGSKKPISKEELYKYYENNVKEHIENSSLRNEIEEAIRKGQNDRMKLAISSLLPNENKYRTMSDEYLRREYIENAGKLLERIEDIYKKEFQIKIIETKKAIIEYIEPHKEALHELRRKITETSNALAQIDNDRSLLGPDAEIIESSLKEKLVEMRKIEESEIVNIKNIDIFLSEIRKAKEKYSQIIDIIEQKKEKYNKRDKYLALVKSLDISIPELGNIFEELKKEFSSNIEDIKTSIFILGLSINNNLLASIEKQKEINTVLGTGRVGNYKYNEQNTNDMCDYEYDLSFLNDTNK